MIAEVTTEVTTQELATEKYYGIINNYLNLWKKPLFGDAQIPNLPEKLFLQNFILKQKPGNYSLERNMLELFAAGLGGVAKTQDKYRFATNNLQFKVTTQQESTDSATHSVELVARDKTMRFNVQQSLFNYSYLVFSVFTLIQKIVSEHELILDYSKKIAETWDSVNKDGLSETHITLLNQLQPTKQLLLGKELEMLGWTGKMLQSMKPHRIMNTLTSLTKKYAELQDYIYMFSTFNTSLQIVQTYFQNLPAAPNDKYKEFINQWLSCVVNSYQPWFDETRKLNNRDPNILEYTEYLFVNIIVYESCLFLVNQSPVVLKLIEKLKENQTTSNVLTTTDNPMDLNELGDKLTAAIGNFLEYGKKPDNCAIKADNANVIFQLVIELYNFIKKTNKSSQEFHEIEELFKEMKDLLSPNLNKQQESMLKTGARATLMVTGAAFGKAASGVGYVLSYVPYTVSKLISGASYVYGAAKGFKESLPKTVPAPSVPAPSVPAPSVPAPLALPAPSVPAPSVTAPLALPAPSVPAPLALPAPAPSDTRALKKLSPAEKKEIISEATHLLGRKWDRFIDKPNERDIIDAKITYLTNNSDLDERVKVARKVIQTETESDENQTMVIFSQPSTVYGGHSTDRSTSSEATESSETPEKQISREEENNRYLAIEILNSALKSGVLNEIVKNETTNTGLINMIKRLNNYNDDTAALLSENIIGTQLKKSIQRVEEAKEIVQHKQNELLTQMLSRKIVLKRTPQLLLTNEAQSVDSKEQVGESKEEILNEGVQWNKETDKAVAEVLGQIKPPITDTVLPYTNNDDILNNEDSLITESTYVFAEGVDLSFTKKFNIHLTDQVKHALLLQKNLDRTCEATFQGRQTVYLTTMFKTESMCDVISRRLSNVNEISGGKLLKTTGKVYGNDNFENFSDVESVIKYNPNAHNAFESLSRKITIPGVMPDETGKYTLKDFLIRSYSVEINYKQLPPDSGFFKNGLVDELLALSIIFDSSTKHAQIVQSIETNTTITREITLDFIKYLIDIFQRDIYVLDLYITSSGLKLFEMHTVNFPTRAPFFVWWVHTEATSTKEAVNICRAMIPFLPMLTPAPLKKESDTPEEKSNTDTERKEDRSVGTISEETMAPTPNETVIGSNEETQLTLAGGSQPRMNRRERKRYLRKMSHRKIKNV